MSINEKREYVRLNIPTDIICRFGAEEKNGIKFSGQDINLEGVRVLMDRELPLKTSLELEIYFSSISEPVIVYGEVVWQNYTKIGEKDFYETGIKFSKIKWQDKEKIQRTLFDTIKGILIILTSSDRREHLDRLHIDKG